MSRKYRLNRAREHFIYNRQDLRARYNISDRTITNWIKDGLRPVDEGRPQLFAGSELNRFQQWRRSTGRQMTNPRMFACVPCQNIYTPDLASITPLGRDELRRYRILSHCSLCDEPIKRFVASDDYAKFCKPTSNTPRQCADNGDGIFSSRVASSAPRISPIGGSGNLRVVYDYQIYCRQNAGLAEKTLEEHLRALAKMSTQASQKPFGDFRIDDIIAFKNSLRSTTIDLGEGKRSWSTVQHTLRHCEQFFRWFSETDAGHGMKSELPGYFKLDRREQKLAKLTEGRDVPTADETWALMQAMGDATPAQRCKQAILSLMACTGIRVDAAVSLLGGDLDQKRPVIVQDPHHVRTKNSKHMKSHILNWDRRFFDVIECWVDERRNMGFRDSDPLFPPDRYLKSVDGIFSRPDPIKCWETPNAIQTAMRNAHQPAGLGGRKITPHCLRSMIVLELMKRPLTGAQLVAISKNLGHANVEVTLRHYANMSDDEIAKQLDSLKNDHTSPDEKERSLIDRYNAQAIRPDDPLFAKASHLANAHNTRLREVHVKQS